MRVNVYRRTPLGDFGHVMVRKVAIHFYRNEHPLEPLLSQRMRPSSASRNSHAVIFAAFHRRIDSEAS